MSEHKEMTREQLEWQMECYREIYNVVRLIDEDTIQSIQRIKCGELPPDACECYRYWNKESCCDNCISLKAFVNKSTETKLEFQDSDIYQVISRYIVVDGEPCVMELVRKLDEENMLDDEGRNKLIDKLTGYREKLYTDVLTKAYNRRYFEEQVKSMKTAAGIAMIDLDDFKLYNDTSGHSVGDMVLLTVADVIRKCIRKTDILIRYGGDEFLLILPEIGKEDFEQKLKQIKTRIHETVIPGFSKLQISVSIGGTLTNEDSVEETIRKADELMYQAKLKKNMVVTKAILSGDGEESDLSTQTILVVDDSEINREILMGMLRSDFKILEAEDGQSAVRLLQQYGTQIALVLLDIIMPGMDGFDVLHQMQVNKWLEEIPVIVISSRDDDTFIRRAYEMGAADYISRPFDSQVVYKRVLNMLKLYAKQRRLVSLVTDQIYEREKNNRMLITILSHIVEFRNGESRLHVIHINKLTEMILQKLIQKTDKYKITTLEQYLIPTASALHDIGKIGIADEILNKPGKLTEDEFDIMKTHTLIGAEMIEDLEQYRSEPMVKIAYQICRWHHERYDGRGYPDGLKGDEIPIAAQVVSLADVYDALVSERVYKKAFSHEKAIQMIRNGECGTFNPLLMECLDEIEQELDVYIRESKEK